MEVRAARVDLTPGDRLHCRAPAKPVARLDQHRVETTMSQVARRSDARKPSTNDDRIYAVSSHGHPVAFMSRFSPLPSRTPSGTLAAICLVVLAQRQLPATPHAF